MKDVDDQPDDDQPQRGADQQANQETSNRAERIVPGVTTARRHSLSAFPCA